MTGDIQKIKGFTRALVKHEVPPDDEEQKVIERVGDTHNTSALPVLRRALSAAIEYQFWSETLSKSVDPNMLGSASIWIAGALASRMIPRLRFAIEKCTPEDQPVVYEPIKRNTWWLFWK